MAFFFLFVFGALVVENTTNMSASTSVEVEKVQVETNKVVEKKSPLIEVKSEQKKLEPIKKELKPEPKKQEPIKEEVKLTPKVQEPIKEEVKTLEKKADPIKEEIKSETVKEIDSPDETGTSWLKLVLYIMGPILIIVLGKNLYSRIKNNSLSNKQNDYMRKEFKEKIQPETTEQQPTEEEAQPETTEQQPTEEDESNNKK